MYKPREDSFLLQKQVMKYAKGFVLDIGTGSGIQAITAAKKADSVIAVDIDKKAIDYCKKRHRFNNVLFVCSDLFSFFKNNFVGFDKKTRKFIIKNKTKNKIKKTNKFDLVIFNPPYLPSELKLKDLTIEGGKKGYEILERFLDGVKNYLKKNGKALIVFSSLTNKKKVNEIIKRNKLKYKQLTKQKMFFEKIYVYLVF